MDTSLEKLVESLPHDNFRILDQKFEKNPSSDIKLLHGKGFYPSSYIDYFDRFKESKFPALKNSVSSWQGENNVPSITQSQQEKAQKFH